MSWSWSGQLTHAVAGQVERGVMPHFMGGLLAATLTTERTAARQVAGVATNKAMTGSTGRHVLILALIYGEDNEAGGRDVAVGEAGFLEANARARLDRK